MSNYLLIALMIEYVVIAVSAVIERNWGMVMYFVGAVILTGGVLWMK